MYLKDINFREFCPNSRNVVLAKVLERIDSRKLMLAKCDFSRLAKINVLKVFIILFWEHNLLSHHFLSFFGTFGENQIR